MTDGDSVTINNLRDSANGTFVTLDDYLLLTRSATFGDPRRWLAALHCDGSPHPRAAGMDGAVLAAGRRLKERTHPELLVSRSRGGDWGTVV